MVGKKVPAEYRIPAAVYRFPTGYRQVEVEYQATKCQSSGDAKNPGYMCGNTFLKLHGYSKNYLLVPSGRAQGPLLFSALDSKGQRTQLPTPKNETLMNPIESDFVDVHGGDGDCR